MAVNIYISYPPLSQTIFITYKYKSMKLAEVKKHQILLSVDKIIAPGSRCSEAKEIMK
jgi:hypothetical protein